MKKYILLFMFTMLAIWLSAQELSEGVWLAGEDNTKIETYQKDGVWYGKIISSDNPKAQIGKNILQGFINTDNIWKGKLYAAKKGKLLDAVIEPSKDDLQIIVSAGFFKKKLIWSKETKD